MLESGEGTVDARIQHALDVLVEELGVDTAFVNRFRRGLCHITHRSGLPLADELQAPKTVDSTICRLVAAGELEALVPDTGVHPVLAGHPDVRRIGITSYAGVPLVVDGDIVGAVCAVAADPVPGWSDRDADRLATVGEFIGRVLTSAERPGPSDSGGSGTHEAGAAGAPLPDLADLAQTVAGSRDLESLTRPLLEVLQSSTGLESTYLTFVDWVGDRQQIVYSLNVGELDIPEGLTVPWSDTLCQRSLDAGIPYTADVPSLWGDSEAARQLGIRTYVSVPITDADQAVIGTLCGAGTASVDLQKQHLGTMQLFSRVLAEEISRERAEHRERARAEALAQRTRSLWREDTVDALTGLHNRTGIQEWLTTAIETLETGREQLAIAFFDIDDLTTVNDVYGSEIGDDVLRCLAAALRNAGRPGDLQGRWGGDEFVAAAVLAPSDASFGNWTHQQQMAAKWFYQTPDRFTGPHQTGGHTVHASLGAITVVETATSPEHALQVAEQAMSRHKARSSA
ncbi:diguanylate cyclase [Kineosporia sp. NBRC 101731]|uniref:sensor domain-containing diguanylate cyclase n=1 Tax=Kineosporia sp. NBRC 101731 TaxID=3032199 RepID=UPI0025576B31|nr:diguanylate cyclase [Kineosporia sp. NBRC 101731]